MKNIYNKTEFLNENFKLQIGDLTIRKIGSRIIKGDVVSLYDISDDVRDRVNMFSITEDKNGWYINASFVPFDFQRQGIATAFYIKMNELSLKKTKRPLKSTPPVTLSSGKTMIDLSDDGVALWESFVRRGLAVKLGEKSYQFISL